MLPHKFYVSALLLVAVQVQPASGQLALNQFEAISKQESVSFIDSVAVEAVVCTDDDPNFTFYVEGCCNVDCGELLVSECEACVTGTSGGVPVSACEVCCGQCGPYTPPAVETDSPTSSPTSSPTTSPTTSPTSSPTTSPTTSPTSSPTSSPTTSPTTSPSASPTYSMAPSESPSSSPSSAPSASPSVSCDGSVSQACASICKNLEKFSCAYIQSQEMSLRGRCNALFKTAEKKGCGNYYFLD